MIIEFYSTNQDWCTFPLLTVRIFNVQQHSLWRGLVRTRKKQFLAVITFFLFFSNLVFAMSNIVSRWSFLFSVPTLALKLQRQFWYVKKKMKLLKFCGSKYESVISHPLKHHIEQTGLHIFKHSETDVVLCRSQNLANPGCHISRARFIIAL